MPVSVKPEIVYDISTLDTDNTIKLGVLFKVDIGKDQNGRETEDIGD